MIHEPERGDEPPFRGIAARLDAELLAQQQAAAERAAADAARLQREGLSHCSGQVFDIDYSGLPPDELECLRFVLNDLGWEVWPGGLEQALHAAARLGRPVLVTENGIADAHDTIRPRALVSFVEAMHRAITAGVPVLGYLHWSLLDNFEWSEGYHGRFGLYAVDFDAPERTRTRRRSPSRSRSAKDLSGGIPSLRNNTGQPAGEKQRSPAWC